MRPSRRAPFALCLASIALLAGGCAGDRAKPAPGAIQRGPVPSYTDIAARYNARVAPLESLWTRTILRLWYHDREGREHTDQLEGYFQFRRPRSVNLTLQKVGQNAAVLGSSDTLYWFMDLGDAKTARVGEHARATPERIADLGLPVYPLDLLGLVGVTPLPGLDALSSPPAVAWSADGRSLVVTLALGEAGSRRLTLDPQTLEPSRIEALDPAGTPVLVSDLSRYTPVAMIGAAAGAPAPRVAGEVAASFDRDRTRVRMRLNDPESGGKRPTPAVFDFDTLVNSYGIRRVERLDNPGHAALDAAPESRAASPTIPR
jgi:hypothetical protein